MVTRPDSILTGFRRRLARAIEPGPDPGEAWCVRCGLNEGRTLILSADGAVDHAGTHRGSGEVTIQVAWPSGKRLPQRGRADYGIMRTWSLTRSVTVRSGQ